MSSVSEHIPDERRPASFPTSSALPMTCSLLEAQFPGRDTITFLTESPVPTTIHGLARRSSTADGADVLEFQSRRTPTWLTSSPAPLQGKTGTRPGQGRDLFIPGAACIRTGQNCCVPASQVLAFPRRESAPPCFRCSSITPPRTPLSFRGVGYRRRPGGDRFRKGTRGRGDQPCPIFNKICSPPEKQIYSARRQPRHPPRLRRTQRSEETRQGLPDSSTVPDESELRFDKLLGAAIALSKVHQGAETEKPRVGIILPPEQGRHGRQRRRAAGRERFPVNLNFTAGKAAVESCIEPGRPRPLSSPAPPSSKNCPTSPGPTPASRFCSTKCCRR